MILQDASLWLFSSPLVAPVEVTPGVHLHSRETLLVEFSTDDGRTAWGEAAPLPGFSCESLDEVIEAGRILVATIRAHRPPADAGGLPESVASAVAGLPSLEFAVEAAVQTLIGPGVEPVATVRTAQLLQGSRTEIVESAAALVRAGHSCLKVKVGRGGVDEDVALLEQIRGRVGAGPELRCDANRSWTWDDAIRFAEGVVDLDLEFVEEPLRDPKQAGEFCRETTLRLALDESVAEWDVRAAVDIPPYVSAVVLKPTLLGWRRTGQLIRSAKELGIGCVLSSCYESGVGTSAVVRAAMLSSAHSLATGVGTIAWIKDDCVVPRVDLERPELRYSEVSGSAVRPVRDRLQAVPSS